MHIYLMLFSLRQSSSEALIPEPNVRLIFDWMRIEGQKIFVDCVRFGAVSQSIESAAFAFRLLKWLNFNIDSSRRFILQLNITYTKRSRILSASHFRHTENSSRNSIWRDIFYIGSFDLNVYYANAKSTVYWNLHSISSSVAWFFFLFDSKTERDQSLFTQSIRVNFM